MKKYQIDWVQFICALITVAALVGAVAAMFVFPRAPWPVTFPPADRRRRRVVLR